MKSALQPLGCGPDTFSPSKGHHGRQRGLLGAFLFRLCEREVEKELESYFRVTEAMGLNPNGAVPPFLSARISRVHSLVTNLSGVSFPLQPAQSQQQPKQP